MSSQAQSAIVTILYSDLVNSTQLLEKLGEEKARRVFEAHHAALREAAHGHAGQELEWLGDGILAEFPSAADAVSSAIAMQKTTRRAIEGQKLQIRVGIASGEVFRREGGYFGETMVVARRVCDSAEAGQVLCSGVVADFLAARQGFKFQDRGPQYLKGISRAIPVSEVVSAPTRAPAQEAKRLLSIALGAPRRALFAGRLGWVSYPLTIENGGGKTLGVDLHAFDASRRCRFQFPGRVTVPAGEAETVEMKVRPVTRRWRGKQEDVPFTVSAQAGDGRPPIVVAGQLADRSYGWLPYAGGSLALGGAAAIGALVALANGDDDGTAAAGPADPVDASVQIYALAERPGGYEAVGWGSGTIIDPTGLIVTSSDLVNPDFYGQPFTVLGVGITEDATQPATPEYAAEVMTSDELLGIAVLQVTSDQLGNPVDPDDLQLPAVALGDSEALSEGDQLQLLGYPGSGGGSSSPQGGVGTQSSADPFDVQVSEVASEVTGFPEVFPSGRGSFNEIAVDATLTLGHLGGGGFNEGGKLIGLLYPAAYGSDPGTVDLVEGHVRPLSLFTAQIEEGRERAAREEFACAGCVEEEQLAEERPTIDYDALRPEFTDFAYALSVDDQGGPEEPVEAIPNGVFEFYVFFNYAGMVDGAQFRYHCFNEPELPFSSFPENLERDYGASQTVAWEAGQEGRSFVVCSTVGTELDGRPLPQGQYVVAVEVENLVQNPFGEPTVTFTVYGLGEVFVLPP
jgi:class 3 adenylate cyclase/S1-C subfamily serine protease